MNSSNYLISRSPKYWNSLNLRALKEWPSISDHAWFGRVFADGADWPDPQIVSDEVKKQLTGLECAESNSVSLTIGAWNLEFLDFAKASYFIESYKETVKRHHLLAVEEVDKAGLAVIAETCGYQYFVSTPNSRGQAVGFFVNKRLKVLECIEYPELIGVCGVPDLRPALRLDLQDVVTGRQFSTTVLHLKSMRGGLRLTSLVRYQQLLNLAQCLKTVNGFSLVTGDFNCFLDHTRDTLPLTNNGYLLADRWNQSATHHFGGRLDGLFCANKPRTVRVGDYSIRNFWRNSRIGCALSDHGLLSWKLQAFDSDC